MTDATHAEFTALIARGERKQAAALLVRDHAAAVFALCRAIVRDARLAEDLSQDAFLQAFGALARFRGDAAPRTWLLRIARNRCLDHLERARRAPWANSYVQIDHHAAEASAPDDLVSAREGTAIAISVLGEIERALVVLHFGHGVAYRELAESFGLREGAVRMRISRALARMRAALCDDDEFADEVTRPFLVIPGSLLAVPGAAGVPPAPPGGFAEGSTAERLPEPATDQPPALAFLSLPDEVPPALQTRLDALVGD